MKNNAHHFLFGTIGIMAFAVLFAGTASAGQAEPGSQPQGQSATSQTNQFLVKSYTLRYIKPEEVLRAGRFYYQDATVYGNTIMVKIWSQQVPGFEKLLAALDVAPKTVLFRVYPIIATRGGGETKKSEAAIDPELRKVLDEMNTLWKFESYYVEGPSYIPVKEATGPDSFKLLSSHQMNLLVSEVKVTGEEAGKRTITIGELKLSGQVNFLDLVFLDTHDVVLKENGYLVAGVSGYVGSDRALILVLNGEIK